MEKQEFIENLKVSLNGRVAPSVVIENVNFYEDYINTEIRKGRNQQEVLDSLGDPRLIAKTIAETNPQDIGDAQDGDYRNVGQNGYSGKGSSFYRDNPYHNRQSGQRNMLRVPGWVWLIAVILIIVLILSAVFSVISFLMPILLPILLVVFLIKLFRDWLN